MTEENFWEIVAGMDWPNIHYSDAKLRFMRRYDRTIANEFRALYLTKLSAVKTAAATGFVCDSWDDAVAHTVGLGKEEFYRCLENPEGLIRRESSDDYVESFSYCIPFPEDYELLCDTGYERHFPMVRKLKTELEQTDPDDIAPRLYRIFPLITEVCELLLQKRWNDAVDTYHRNFGPGYADEWPLSTYLLPNMIKNLEQFRLNGDDGE